MADVTILAPKILKWESTLFTCNPNDAGGATKDGITFATFAEWFKRVNGKDATIDDLKNMSLETFAAILKTDFWDKCQGDLIADQQVANIIVDWFWGSGYDAIKEVQEIAGIDKPTGFFGSLTLAAVNSKDPATLTNAIADARIKFYNDIVSAHPNWQEFKQGWINRANDYRYKSVA